MAQQREAASNEHTMDIRSGLAILHSLYKLTMDEFDYLDLAINELRDIKHFGSTEYIAVLTVDEEGYIDLPCNIDTIDAVTTVRMGLKAFAERVPYEMQAIDTDEYYAAVAVMKSINHGYHGLTEFRTGEGYINYHLNGKRIKVDKSLADQKIAVAFTGVAVDPEGYPKITRKQANALAHAAATAITLQKAMKGDRNAAGMLEYLKTEKMRFKQAASIPEDISDNEIDEMLDVQTTFNRKSYKRPTKYSR